MKDELQITDWRRVFIGEVPVEFFLELGIRALTIYLILMVSMRMMGKRMSSQLSRNELAALVSLAAAIGVPMMAPDRGLLPAVVIAFVLISMQRLIAKIAFHHQKFEKFSQGNVSTLIKNSVIDVKALESIGLSQERLFAELRCNAILQLGQVERLYMEANGSFTLIELDKPQSGLCILPLQDEDFLKEIEFSATRHVCGFCGNPQTMENELAANCSNCNRNEWQPAVSEKEVYNES